MADSKLGLDKNTFEKFEKNLQEIEEMVNIGSDVISIAVGLVEGLSKEYESIEAFVPYKEKLKANIGGLKRIKENSELKKKYNILYNQALVLVVSNFESFLSDFSKFLIEKHDYLLEWPDKKISLDLEMFNYFTPTVGDIVLASLKEKYSFQDLESSLNFLKEFLSIDVRLSDETKDNIILFHALRHIIIHNSSTVDEKFLKQIRKTRFAFTYDVGQKVSTSEEQFQKAKSEFSKLATEIFEKKNKELNDLLQKVLASKKSNESE